MPSIRATSNRSDLPSKECLEDFAGAGRERLALGFRDPGVRSHYSSERGYQVVADEVLRPFESLPRSGRGVRRLRLGDPWGVEIALGGYSWVSSRHCFRETIRNTIRYAEGGNPNTRPISCHLAGLQPNSLCRDAEGPCSRNSAWHPMSGAVVVAASSGAAHIGF